MGEFIPKSIDDEITAYDEELADTADFNEITKIINTQKNFKRCREFIIKHDTYSNEQKIRFFEMLDLIYKRKNTEVRTSSYDGKPYSMTFFNDFLDFLNNNYLTQNEMKFIISIYAILSESNTYGNVLLSVTNQTLSQKSGIDLTNISKTIKSLVAKGLIKKQESSIYLNYEYFFRGSKIEYDRFKSKFDTLDSI